MKGLRQMNPLPRIGPSDIPRPAPRPARADGMSVLDSPEEQKRKLALKVKKDAADAQAIKDAAAAQAIVDAAAAQAIIDQQKLEMEKAAAEADAERARQDSIDAENKATQDAVDAANKAIQDAEAKQEKIRKAASDAAIAEQAADVAIAQKAKERREELEREKAKKADARRAEADRIAEEERQRGIEYEASRKQKENSSELTPQAVGAVEQVKTKSPVFSDSGINALSLVRSMAAATGPFSGREQGGFKQKAGDGVDGNGGSRRTLECPQSLFTDSYKLAHFLQYPKAVEMSAYGEFRGKYDGMDDNRIVFYGLRYYMSQFISSKMSDADLARSAEFVRTHIPGSDNSACFESFRQNNGYFPVKIEVMPEGSVVRPHIPVYKITAVSKDGKDYSRLVTFLETMLTMVWYPSTVATLSRTTKELIKRAYLLSVDEIGTRNFDSLDSRLHDFGFRGCTCLEQSVLGGSAHLLSFTGSDTMSACYHVQYHLNDGKPRGISLPATEHSVMTSWPSEAEAVINLLEKFPKAPFIACVMDSYDYEVALETILPVVASILKTDIQCGRIQRTFVIRPDSGDAVEQVLKGLQAAKIFFTHSQNDKGYTVIENCCVIQGDGIDYTIIDKILRAVMSKGFSACNVAFGMGAGLLQKVNRDTMQFATKLSFIQYNATESKKVMKAPKGRKEKWSLPGKNVVMKKRLPNGVYGPHIVCTDDESIKLLKRGYTHSMITVYDGGNELTGDELNEQELFYSETHDAVRARMEKEWEEASSPEEAVHSSMTDLQNSEAATLGRLTYAIRVKNNMEQPSELASKLTVSQLLVWKLDRILDQ